MSQGALVGVACVAAFFFVMGVVALVRPERVLAYFGTHGLTRDGRNEVRAVYGGFGVAIALLLLSTLWLPQIRLGVLVSVAVALSGMASGRLISTVLEGSPGRFTWFIFGLEVVMAGALYQAIRYSS